jgi:hypothetical protein
MLHYCAASPKAVPNPLPSDVRFRKDLQMLASGDLEAAQVANSLSGPWRVADAPPVCPAERAGGED